MFGTHRHRYGGSTRLRSRPHHQSEGIHIFHRSSKLVLTAGAAVAIIAAAATASASAAAATGGPAAHTQAQAAGSGPSLFASTAAASHAQLARPVRPVKMINLHHACADALPHARVGKLAGIIYPRGRQPKAAVNGGMRAYEGWMMTGGHGPSK
jgi:hypothetical protein